MLTEKETREISAHFGGYPLKRAAATEALMIVQRHRGWISSDSISDIAAFLDMTPDELDAIATFYSLIYRHPVGRHVILICDSVSCFIMGYDDVRRHIQARLGVEFGETTEDRRFTLLPVACLGECDRAPAMMVDDEIFGNLTPARVDDILSRYR